MAYQLILIGGDCGENRFWKDKGAMQLIFDIVNRTVEGLRVAAKDEMNSRLITVHRVEHDLRSGGKQTKL